MSWAVTTYEREKNLKKFGVTVGVSVTFPLFWQWHLPDDAGVNSQPKIL